MVVVTPRFKPNPGEGPDDPAAGHTSQLFLGRRQAKSVTIDKDSTVGKASTDVEEPDGNRGLGRPKRDLFEVRGGTPVGRGAPVLLGSGFLFFEVARRRWVHSQSSLAEDM